MGPDSLLEGFRAPVGRDPWEHVEGRQLPLLLRFPRVLLPRLLLLLLWSLRRRLRFLLLLRLRVEELGGVREALRQRVLLALIAF